MIKTYLKSKSGAVLPLAAMMFPVLLGLGGLGTDLSNWMETRRNLQTAADAAAIAGTWEASRGEEDLVEYAASKEAVSNGFDITKDGVIETIYDPETRTTTVTISQTADLFLTKILMDEPITTGVTAIAEYKGNDGKFCILSLDEEESQAMTTSGTVDLIMPDCGIAVNSKAEDALQLNGNVEIDVKDIAIVGDYDISGSSATLEYENMERGTAPVPDPYANLEEPTVGACNYTNHKVTGGGSKTLNPGIYCGGISISGNNTVTFNPGLYILKGGTLKITGGGSITANGVTFFLTNDGTDFANVDISGGKNMTFTAPDETGEFPGIAFYQDQDAPTTGTNGITGTSNVYVDGVMYFPNQELNFGGNTAATSDVCTKAIGRTVIMHGTPYIGNDCSGSDAEPIGNPLIRLIG